MKLTESILRPVKKIHGGVLLPHLKKTAESETVIMPPPERVIIPMQQHIGAPCAPTVKKGDEVFVGTKIGDSDAFVSAPVHSSVSGTVSAVKEFLQNGRPVMSVEIASDGKMTPDPSLAPREVKTAADIAAAARDCGLVGLGGAGFPAHVKLTPKDGVKIDTLVVNAAECEPYLTADYRECMESSDDIMEGVYLLKSVLGLERVIIAVESNKPRAIEKLYGIAADRRDEDDSVKLMKLPTSYPQGAEKVIVYSATGRLVPPGGLPADVGCIVMNVTSVAVLYRFIKTGMPLVAKRITVEGKSAVIPQNILVPIGTAVEEVIAFAGGAAEDAACLIAGGPMMGNAITDKSSVIEKRNNGLLITPEPPEYRTTACIRCGRCADACPLKLRPAAVETAYRHGLEERYSALNVSLCMECGSCSYVCPAKRPLTQVMRTAKAQMRRNAK